MTISSVMCRKLWTLRPATSRISSSACMPACHAAPPAITPPTTVGFCFTPKRKATTAKTRAKIMFMITPAEMMAIRWGTLFAR